MTKGLLIAAFNYSGAHADEFHDWYDLEHIPERKAVSGFGLCERWIGDEDANISIATYDLDTVDVMRSDAYCAIGYANSSVWTKRVTGMCTRLLRFDGIQITPGDAAAVDGAGALLVNAMNVALEGEVDFNAWYDEEHLPGLSAVPGTLAARRYRARDDDPDRTHQYVAVYHLESADVTRGDAWKKAVDTPWSARVRPYFRDRIRILSGRYVRGG
jgi:hypothetical protein